MKIKTRDETITMTHPSSVRPATPAPVRLWAGLLILLAGLLAAAPALAQNASAVKIGCVARGIYKVTGADLASKGVNLGSVDVARMALVHYDKSVPIYCVGMDDGRFDPQDAFYFFAEGSLEDSIPYINIEKDFHPIEQIFMLHLGAGEFAPLRYKTIELKSPDRPDIQNYPTQTVSGRSHFEKNPIWQFFEEDISNTGKTDFLFWSKMTYPASNITASSTNCEFTLPTFDPRRDVQLRVKLFDASEMAGNDDLHRVAVVVNERQVGEVKWSGKPQYEGTLTIPPQAIRKGANKVQFSVLEPQSTQKAPVNPDPQEGSKIKIDLVMLDWFELKFKQETEVRDNYNEFELSDAADLQTATRFNIRNFTAPGILVFDLARQEFLKARPFAQQDGAARYAVNIERTSGPATTLVALTDAKAQKPFEMAPVTIRGLFSQPADCDLLILTHPAFVKTLEPFVQWKRSRGLKVQVADITDIFNEKSGGCAAPAPLRDYVQYLYEHPKGARLKYVLLVGDSVTISKYQTFCPAYAYLQSGTHANDNYYGAFDTPNGKPVVAVGRFSVRTPAQLENIIKKTINYESGRCAGPWMDRFFVIAAAFDWARTDAKNLMDHYVKPNQVATYLQTDIQNRDPNYHAQLTQELVNQFNAGSLVTAFFGHGGGSVWEVGPSSRHDYFRKHLFDQSNVAALTNYDRLPLVFAMTCYTNDFDNPHVPQTLGETFVNSPGGAIAVLGTTCRSSTTWNARFILTFFQTLKTMRSARLGDLVNQTKYGMNSGTCNANYTLLGDPTLEFKLPQADLQISNIKGSASSVSFDFKLPQDVKVPVTLECYLIGEKEELLAQWKQDASGRQGTVNYRLAKGSAPMGAARVIASLTADGSHVEHIGGAPLPTSAAPKTVAAKDTRKK